MTLLLRTSLKAQPNAAVKKKGNENPIITFSASEKCDHFLPNGQNVE